MEKMADGGKTGMRGWELCEVTLRRSRLVLRWVTVREYIPSSYM